jgi:hypothetical protein
VYVIFLELRKSGVCNAARILMSRANITSRFTIGTDGRGEKGDAHEKGGGRSEAGTPLGSAGHGQIKSNSDFKGF